VNESAVVRVTMKCKNVDDLPIGEVNAHLLPSSFSKPSEAVKKEDLLIRGPSTSSLSAASCHRVGGS
jgi:hypothetical protein